MQQQNKLIDVMVIKFICIGDSLFLIELSLVIFDATYLMFVCSVCVYIYIYIYIYIHMYIYSIYIYIYMCVCVFMCVWCVCVRPFAVKASSVWISQTVREQINDVLLKKFISYAKSLHCQFRMKHLTFLTSHFILFTHYKWAKPRLN